MPGFTCCVPGCFNNNKRERHLKFYNFPKDPLSRNLWIKNIGRAGSKGKFSQFKPTCGHRVCSEHFEGGERTYMIRVPTNFPLKDAVCVKTRRPIIRENLSVGCSQQSVSASDVLTNDHDEDINCVTSGSEYVSEHTYSLSETNPDYLLEIIKEKCKVIDAMEMRIAQLGAELDETKVQLEQCKSDVTKSRLQASENLGWKRKYYMTKTKLDLVNRHQLNKTFCVSALRKRPEAIKFYTGFKSFQEFKVLFRFLEPDIKHLQYLGSMKKGDAPSMGANRTLTTENELFLVLARVRAGLLSEDLAYRFAIHVSTVSRICRTYFDLLHRRFRQIPIWPLKHTVDKHMPECFKQAYPSTRVILDCTELFIETPSHFRVQSETYSSYKSHNTAKGLVGISPNGFISFVTDLVPGKMSDKEITVNSGLIELLSKGDSVMADRGFLIDEYLAKKNVGLNIPPFLGGNFQLSPEHEEQTRRIARVRIHVERVIERIKNYRILNFVFPNSMANDLNKIWVICCYLVNFTTEPIVGDK